ncbi:Clp protease N-terminal domain-containing protein [Tengunoibacter tsumagoiensis]|uniref:Clp R domain-containing protein n=1 Tax=Tengunoibacter tsumagoiensis TaxID=2014871 RepID=A0A402A3K2_9CHLR|nr:Clp protease N-terminal domain-containing protein [Tengunoibacter tsumagoiensis]GCE13727.1 hypothetical protein KTT_35860 [Tengunoibacter tsumagoiensis]
MSIDDQALLEKFNESARKILDHAQEEANYFYHNYIGTEHLLLGILHEVETVASVVLKSFGVQLETVRKALEYIVGRGETVVSGPSSITPRTREVIRLAIEEAQRLNAPFVGTEHLLLGLVREGEGIGASILKNLAGNLNRISDKTLEAIAQQKSE